MTERAWLGLAVYRAQLPLHKHFLSALGPNGVVVSRFNDFLSYLSPIWASHEAIGQTCNRGSARRCTCWRVLSNSRTWSANEGHMRRRKESVYFTSLGPLSTSTNKLAFPGAGYETLGQNWVGIFEQRMLPVHIVLESRILISNLPTCYGLWHI
jgi:hypothetical protein